MARTVDIFSGIVFSGIVVAAFCGAVVAQAAESLLLVDQPPSEALFVGSKNDSALEFQVATETRTVPLRDFIRWSNPQRNVDRHEVILVDGSRLVLAESWTGDKALQVSPDTVTVLTQGLGKVVIPRSKLRAVLLNAPKSSLRRLRLRDQFFTSAEKNDQVWLTNGDTLAGRILEISSSVKFTLAGTSEPVSILVDRLAGLTFGSPSKPAGKGKLVVGWRDGSYLVANSLVAEARSLQIELACGVKLTGTDLREVVYLQSLRSRAVYLSDLEATDYQHKPFLSIPWQYHRDRNLQGGPLVAGRSIYPKGLAMHSASRLTYDIPRLAASGHKKRLHRFAAQVAVDDSAEGGGSVVFQIFLRQANGLQLAHTTPVVRGGAAPLPISVELGDAEQIVLAVEYADRGDQQDHADWLDARLE